MSSQPTSAPAIDSPVVVRTRRPSWIRRILFVLAISYIGWVLLALVAQDFLIYMGAYRSAPDSETPPDPAITQLWLTPAEGIRVEGWFMPGEGRSAESPGPVVLFLHGNKHHVDDVWRFHTPYTAAGYSFLAVDYRGYGRSRGTPNADVLVSDALAWYDRLIERPEVDKQQVVVHANSLGGALAIEIAAARPVRALLLESTFVDIDALFPRLLLPPFICRTSFRSGELIQKVKAPVLIVHGRNDWIIPASNGEALADAAQNKDFVVEYVETDAGHTNYEPEWTAIRRFLHGQGLPMPE